MQALINEVGGQATAAVFYDFRVKADALPSVHFQLVLDSLVILGSDGPESRDVGVDLLLGGGTAHILVEDAAIACRSVRALAHAHQHTLDALWCHFEESFATLLRHLKQPICLLPQLETVDSHVILGSDGLESFGHDAPSTCSPSSDAFGGSCFAAGDANKEAQESLNSLDSLALQVVDKCGRHVALNDKLQLVHISVHRFFVDEHALHFSLGLLWEEFDLDFGTF
jgi:hypothetical protein